MIKEIVKNDIRYLRRGLIGWAGLLLLPLAGFAGLHTGLGQDPHYWDMLPYGLILLFIVQMVTQILLVARLVQKENLRDPRAYWLTRPLPRGQLLIAKLFSAVMLFLLPQLLQVGGAALLFSGEWGPVLAALQWGSTIFAALLVASLILAGITRSPGAALLGYIGLPVGLTIVELAGFQNIRVPVQDVLSHLLGDAGVLLHLLLNLALVFGLTGFALRYWQSRRGLSSLLCLGFALLCWVFSVSLDIPKSVPQAKVALPASASLKVDPVRFFRQDIAPGGGSSTGQGSRTADSWNGGGARSVYGLSADLLWSGIPGDWLVESEAIKTFGPDGALWGRPDQEYQSSFRSSYSAELIRALFPNYRPDPQPGRVLRQQLFLSPQIKPAEIEWPVTLSTGFATRVYAASKEQLLLAEGSLIQLGNALLLIESIEHLSTELSLTFRFMGVPPVTGYDRGWEAGFFALRIPGSGEVIVDYRSTGGASHLHSFFQTGRFELTFEDVPSNHSSVPAAELYLIQLDLLGIEVRRERYVVERDLAGH